MLRYIAKRLLQLIPVVLGACCIVFFLVSMTKEDPVSIILADSSPDPVVAEKLRSDLGLDKPLVIQFFNYVKNFLIGDMGTSYKYHTPVLQEYWKRFPSTLKLSVAAIIVATLLSIPIGIISAVKKHSLFDNIGMTVAMVGVSMPHFWLGLLLILYCAVKWRILPATSMDMTAKSLILPAITLGLSHGALVARMTRSSMLEVINSDYIRTARAKGVREWAVIIKHALGNALIPIVTVVGNQFGHFLGGAMVVEQIFALPGVGRYMIEGINNRDRPVVVGCVVMLCIMISVVNLLIDLIYAWIDPRIKSTMAGKRRMKKHA